MADDAREFIESDSDSEIKPVAPLTGSQVKEQQAGSMQTGINPVGKQQSDLIQTGEKQAGAQQSQGGAQQSQVEEPEASTITNTTDDLKIRFDGLTGQEAIFALQKKLLAAGDESEKNEQFKAVIQTLAYLAGGYKDFNSRQLDDAAKAVISAAQDYMNNHKGWSFSRRGRRRKSAVTAVLEAFRQSTDSFGEEAKLARDKRLEKEDDALQKRAIREAMATGKFKDEREADNEEHITGRIESHGNRAETLAGQGGSAGGMTISYDDAQSFVNSFQRFCMGYAGIMPQLGELGRRVNQLFFLISSVSNNIMTEVRNNKDGNTRDASRKIAALHEMISIEAQGVLEETQKGHPLFKVFDLSHWKAIGTIASPNFVNFLAEGATNTFIEGDDSEDIAKLKDRLSGAADEIDPEETKKRFDGIKPLLAKKCKMIVARDAILFGTAKGLMRSEAHDNGVEELARSDKLILWKIYEEAQKVKRIFFPRVGGAVKTNDEIDKFLLQVLVDQWEEMKPRIGSFAEVPKAEDITSVVASDSEEEARRPSQGEKGKKKEKDKNAKFVLMHNGGKSDEDFINMLYDNGLMQKYIIQPMQREYDSVKEQSSGQLSTYESRSKTGLKRNKFLKALSAPIRSWNKSSAVSLKGKPAEKAQIAFMKGCEFIADSSYRDKGEVASIIRRYFLERNLYQEIFASHMTTGVARVTA